MSLLKVVFKYMRQSLMYSSVLLFSLGIVPCVEFTTTTLLSNPECENFFVDLRNKIIIIVSHLEKIPPKSFNKHIRIDDGKIFVKKLHKDISSSE